MTVGNTHNEDFILKHVNYSFRIRIFCIMDFTVKCLYTILNDMEDDVLSRSVSTSPSIRYLKNQVTRDVSIF